MFRSNFQSDPGIEPKPPDPVEQLISHASKQYKELRYPGASTFILPDNSGRRETDKRWQWLAAAAVLIVAVAAIGIWFPSDPVLRGAEPVVNWQPESRQPSPYAALAAARTALASETSYAAPMLPKDNGFRLPGAPHRTSGFSADRKQSS